MLFSFFSALLNAPKNIYTYKNAHTQYTSPPSSKSVDTESGVKLISRSSAEQLVEPTSIGSSATRKGLRRQAMDNVVMASYQANTSSLSRTKPKTTPTRAAPTAPTRAAPPPSSRGGGSGVKQSSPRQPSSSHSTPTTTADHPMTATRAPGSRSPSQPARSIATTTTAGVASSSAKVQPSSVAADSSVKSAKSNSTASSSKKNAEANHDSSGKSTRASSVASSSRRGNGGKIQSKNEDILEHQESEQGDSEVPMDFPREQIKLGKEFGEGDFGKVFQAEAKKLLPGQKKTTVVVKRLKEGATKEERDVFLRPVEAMK